MKEAGNVRSLIPMGFKRGANPVQFNARYIQVLNNPVRLDCILKTVFIYLSLKKEI